MNEAQAVSALGALAHTQRLRVFRALVIAGPEGLTPSAMADQLEVARNALSFHLKELVAAGWLVIGPGADARSRLIEATEAGRAKRAEAQRRWKVAQERVNQLLGNAGVHRLHAALDAAMRGLAG